MTPPAHVVLIEAMRLALVKLDVTVDNVEETRIVALRDCLFVGTLAIRHRGRVTAGIRQVFVHPDCRRQGIGVALMEEARILAEGSGCQSIGVSIIGENRGVAPFYQRLGYFFAYEYDDQDVVMVKHLTGL